MKTTGRCPKCACERLFVVDEVKHARCDIHATRPTEIVGAELPNGQTGLFGGEVTELTMADAPAAWICSACGFVEYYVSRPALRLIERFVERNAVRVVEKKPPPTPFR